MSEMLNSPLQLLQRNKQEAHESGAYYRGATAVIKASKERFI